MILLNYLYTLDVTNMFVLRDSIDGRKETQPNIQIPEDCDITLCINSIAVEKLNITGNYHLWGFHKLRDTFFYYDVYEIEKEVKDVTVSLSTAPILLSTNDISLYSKLKLVV